MSWSYDQWKTDDSERGPLRPYVPKLDYISAEQLAAQTAVCIACEKPIPSLRDNGMPQTCASCIAKEERGDAWEAGDE